MAHEKRNLKEFIADDTCFRVTRKGELETDDEVLVMSDDMTAFMAWLAAEVEALKSGKCYD